MKGLLSSRKFQAVASIVVALGLFAFFLSPDPLTDVVSSTQPATSICPLTTEPAPGASVFIRSGPLATTFGEPCRGTTHWCRRSAG